MKTKGGLLLPVSRGISKVDNPRQAALDLRDAIKCHTPSNYRYKNNKAGGCP